MGWVKKPEKVFEIDLTKNERLLYRLLLRIFNMLTLHKKMKFSMRNFFSKCDHIHRKLLICSHLLKKPLMYHLIFCVM